MAARGRVNGRGPSLLGRDEAKRKVFGLLNASMAIRLFLVLMIFDQAVDGAFEDDAHAHAGGIDRLFEDIIVIVSDGAYEIYRILLVIVVDDVPAQELLEAALQEIGHMRMILELGDKR